jgi:hypothetical protein
MFSEKKLRVKSFFEFCFHLIDKTCSQFDGYTNLFCAEQISTLYVRFGRPAGEKRVYVDLAKKPTGAANLRI